MGRPHARVLAAVVIVVFRIACPPAMARAAATAFGAADARADCAILPRPSMHIRLTLELGVPEDLRGQIESTVASVWRNEGITVEWLPYAEPGEVLDTDVWMRVRSGPLSDLQSRAKPTLGVVRFIDGLPERRVVLSWGAAREWAFRERDRRVGNLFFGTARLTKLELGSYEESARRVLSFAAAHELGHFVLGALWHDRRGLMRPGILSNTLAVIDTPDLRLSPAARRRLQERLALGASCASSIKAPQ